MSTKPCSAQWVGAKLQAAAHLWPARSARFRGRTVSRANRSALWLFSKKILQPVLHLPRPSSSRPLVPWLLALADVTRLRHADVDHRAEIGLKNPRDVGLLGLARRIPWDFRDELLPVGRHNLRRLRLRLASTRYGVDAAGDPVRLGQLGEEGVDCHCDGEPDEPRQRRAPVRVRVCAITPATSPATMPPGPVMKMPSSDAWSASGSSSIGAKKPHANPTPPSAIATLRSAESRRCLASSSSRDSALS